LELWKNCLFGFDANVLLNLYRYTPNTKDSLLAILEKVSDRIWLPHQAAYEYHNRRLDVIQQQMKAYDSVPEIVQKSVEELKGRLSVFARHPSIRISEILKAFSDALEKYKGTLGDLKQEHPDFLIDDPIKETVSGLFDGKVGEPTAEDQLPQIYKQGEKRYELGRPPGYEDRHKEGTARYSDLVMWFQLIAKAEETKKPVIFVTDDRKEDWWLKSGGKTIGPRPELVQEISDKAAIAFYMYSVDHFMEYANKYLKQRIEEKAIHEVREVRQQDESVSRAAMISRRIDELMGKETVGTDSFLRAVQSRVLKGESPEFFRALRDKVAVVKARLEEQQTLLSDYFAEEERAAKEVHAIRRSYEKLYEEIARGGQDIDAKQKRFAEISDRMESALNRAHDVSERREISVAIIEKLRKDMESLGIMEW
jgi:uncharacterized membrane-anchored protein YhcB (DUF1043 family)